jgi:type VI secretion system FHA domain protein
MPLTLTVLSFKGQPLAHPLSASIADSGGTIGRSDNNTLVLPDSERFVSRQHAAISIKNGCYYLTDSSLSGVYIDNQPQALHNGTEQIFDGTRLKIGEYEIAVSIVEEAKAIDLPFAHPQPNTSLLADNENFLFSSATAENSLLNENNLSVVRHEELLQNDNSSFQAAFESQLQGNRSPIFDSYIPPAIERANTVVEEIPENLSFDDLFSESNRPDKLLDSVDSAKPQPAIANDEAFIAFLQGAGIKDLSIPPQQISHAMQRTGKMFRKLLDGTVALLRSRAEFKSLLRVNMTIIKTTNNNPLKFSVSTEDLMRQLLENKPGGFLDATGAIEEGFTDIMNHQLAMQAGIQAAVTDLLRSFDPELIEREFEQGLVLQKKSKCWDKFSETYQNTVENAIENLFGDAFIEAYEAQMKALTAKHFKT